MNFLKFFLYSAAIIITLGIISDDKEANQMVVDIIHDFEPRIIQALKTIDTMFAQKSYFDSDKINLIVTERIRELDKHLTKIVKSFTTEANEKFEPTSDIKELKMKIAQLEKQVQKSALTKKNKKHTNETK